MPSNLSRRGPWVGASQTACKLVPHLHRRAALSVATSRERASFGYLIVPFHEDEARKGKGKVAKGIP